MIAVLALDYAAAVIFALTGALAASRGQLDLIGFFFLACLTAVGGGTLRDLILDRDPVFWVADPTPLAIACGAALVVFFTAHRFESRLKLLIWLDAVALGVAVAAGVGVAINLEKSVPIILVMGVATGTFGGLMRDVVANEVPLVLKQGELYLTSALIGAAAAITTDSYTDIPYLPAAACIAATFVLRAGSLLFGWRLPVYKPRPPRS